MRRERRLRRRNNNFFYFIGATIILLFITSIVLYKVYNNKLSNISKSMISTEDLIGLTPNKKFDTESASSILSKTIEEVKEDNVENIVDNNIEEIKEDEETIAEEKQIAERTTNNLIENTDSKETSVEEPKPEPKKELAFTYPVQGEIIREFSMENLIYSNTLEEWTTHQGIDIKADRTTVVKAAEEGTVVAIKNDPRYGLTVIIEHQDGFKTVYSNLLTTEFVSEDEHVEKEQTLGTVGNSAVFEIADEPHLHFEIIKDGEYVDPLKYLK